MSEVPMEDRRGAEELEVLRVAAKRAGGEIERVRGGDEVVEGGALDGNGEAAPEGGHVGVEAVVGGDHGEAGEAAFCGFGLADEGKSAIFKQQQKLRNGSIQSTLSGVCCINLLY